MLSTFDFFTFNRDLGLPCDSHLLLTLKLCDIQPPIDVCYLSSEKRLFFGYFYCLLLLMQYFVFITTILILHLTILYIMSETNFLHHCYYVNPFLAFHLSSVKCLLRNCRYKEEYVYNVDAPHILTFIIAINLQMQDVRSNTGIYTADDMNSI